MKDLLKKYQTLLELSEESLERNKNNESVNDIKRNERWLTRRNIMMDLVADLEQANSDNIANIWKIKDDHRKELAEQHKKTRYGAIKIIQDEVNDFDISSTIVDFAETCINKIHNLKQ